MGLPKSFRNVQEPAVASYDFFDLSTTRGYKRFFLTKLSGSSMLSIKEVGSEYVFTILDAVGQKSTDFDFEFTGPMIVAGDAHIVIPQVQMGGGHQTRIDVIIKKVDKSSNVSTLVSLSGSLFTSAATNSYGQYSNLNPDIPRTKFAIGEKLRLTVDFNCYAIGGGEHAMMGHDPLGRLKDANFVPTGYDWSAADYVQNMDTIATFDCPFVVDI